MIWLFKSVLFFGILHFAVLPIADAITRNSWFKLPLMILLALPSGVFMAWFNYVPDLLLLFWCGANYYTLKTMDEEKFKSEIGMKINKPLFWISSYCYIVLTCLVAIFLQMEIGSLGPNGVQHTPLWKHLFGLQ